MSTARTIVKFSIFGFFAAAGGLFLLIQIVPVRYWPVQVCDGGTVTQLASPSKVMVAFDVRDNCDSRNSDKTEMEAKVFIGTVTTNSRQLVFVAPASFHDGQGHEHPVALHMIWKSEDHLEITYPHEIAPTLPGHSFRREDFTVRVTSIPNKMTSNQSPQNGPLPAAGLKH